MPLGGCGLEILSGAFRFFDVWSEVANQMTYPVASCAAGADRDPALPPKGG